VFLEQMARRSTGLTGSYALRLRGRQGEGLEVACFAVPYFDSNGSFWGSRGIIVPYSRVNELCIQNGEGTDDLLRRTLGSPVGPDVGTNGHSFTGSFTPTENAFLSSLLPKLTKRERDVVSLLMVGLRVNGVADRLDLSHYTVRNHLKRIFRKAGVNSQGQLLLKLNAS
jgi:DNA-binding CsgD family transcriptional regulator